MPFSVESHGTYAYGGSFGDLGEDYEGEEGLWWDSGFLYRRRIAITANGVQLPLYYPVTAYIPISVVDKGKAQEDLSDIAVVHSVRQINSYSKKNEDYIHVKFYLQESLEKDAYDDLYWIYYGNPDIGE